MVAGGSITNKGGHDYDFVTPPPRVSCLSADPLWPSHHQLLWFQVLQGVYRHVQRDGKPCPLCNESNFTMMLNKKLARDINALVICCPHKELGCCWEGELGQVHQHLNASSPKGCDYVMVMCQYQCGIQLQRHLIHCHEIDDCPKRPVEMQVVSLTWKFDMVISSNQLLH